jgi:hypothetical protein
VSKRSNSQTEGAAPSSDPLVEMLLESKGRPSVSVNPLMELPVMEDGVTVEALCLQTGRSPETIRMRLRALIAEGRLMVGRKQSRDLLGRTIWVPVYKLVGKKP